MYKHKVRKGHLIIEKYQKTMEDMDALLLEMLKFVELKEMF